MKRFYYQEKVTLTRVKQLTVFIKKYKNFGAYIVVDEVSKDKYNVELFCPQTHIDIFGNRAIYAIRPTRTMPDPSCNKGCQLLHTKLLVSSSEIYT